MTNPTPSADAANGALGRRLVANMVRMTRDRIGGKAIENAERNACHLGRGQSLSALRKQTVGEGDSAIIVAAGPSVRRQDPAAMIKQSGYSGAILCTDSAIYYLLRNGIVPDLVVTLDPHGKRIVRWFGDPALDDSALQHDDYYRRQELDPAFAEERRVNHEILELLDRHGKNMRIALATSSADPVVQRVLDTGMEIYWWNPMLDDPDEPDSVTSALLAQNGLPCVNAGGNVGSACWMMAHLVLGKNTSR